jgi:hypothetical protein
MCSEMRLSELNPKACKLFGQTDLAQLWQVLVRVESPVQPGSHGGC